MPQKCSECFRNALSACGLPKVSKVLLLSMSCTEERNAIGANFRKVPHEGHRTQEHILTIEDGADHHRGSQLQSKTI